MIGAGVVLVIVAGLLPAVQSQAPQPVSGNLTDAAGTTIVLSASKAF